MRRPFQLILRLPGGSREPPGWTHSGRGTNAHSQWMSGPRLSLHLSPPNPAFRTRLGDAGALCSHSSPLPPTRGAGGWAGEGACSLCHPGVAGDPGTGGWFQHSALFCSIPEAAAAQFCGPLSSWDDSPPAAVTPPLSCTGLVPFHAPGFPQFHPLPAQPAGRELLPVCCCSRFSNNCLMDGFQNTLPVKIPGPALLTRPRPSDSTTQERLREA